MKTKYVNFFIWELRLWLQSQNNAGQDSGDGEHCISGAVDYLDGEDPARVPEKMADAVGPVVAEREGNQELCSAQQWRGEMHALHHGEVVGDVIGQR